MALDLNFKTREGAERYVREIIMRGARANFERDGCVDHVSFVFATKQPGGRPEVPAIIMVPAPPMAGNAEKDLYAETVRMIAQATKSVGVVMLLEAWMVDRRPGHEPSDAEYKSLSEHPDRVECLFLTLEHVSGSRSWQCPILRDGGQAKLGEWEELELSRSEGRFTGLNFQWE